MKLQALALLLLSASFVGSVASANDGGVATIKVNDIRMREYSMQGKEIKRIAKPNFKITFTGKEAAKLQKILPSDLSVITGMQPEIKDAFNESFKTLGIYSEKTPQVSAKVISISCVDADLKPLPGDDGKMQVVKRAQSECTISIRATDSLDDEFGDKSEFTPGTCN